MRSSSVLDESVLESAGSAVDREDRVMVVLQAMRTFHWSPGADRELKNLWAITPSAIAEIVAEARGMLRGAISPNKEELRAEFFHRLEYVASKAMAKERAILVRDSEGSEHIERIADPDTKAAVSALKISADLLGLNEKQHIHTHVAQLSQDELERLIAEQLNRGAIVSHGEAHALLSEGVPAGDAGENRDSDEEPFSF